MNFLKDFQTEVRIALLLIILAILIGGGMIVYLQSTPQDYVEVGPNQVSPTPGLTEASPPVTEQSPEQEIDTAGWQTYRNVEWGFEIKYPPGWSVVSDNEHSLEKEFVFSRISTVTDKESYVKRTSLE